MRQLGPFAFDHSAHFIRIMVDVLYIEHVLVEALQVRRQHDLAADQAGLIDSPVIAAYCRLTPRWPSSAPLFADKLLSSAAEIASAGSTRWRRGICCRRGAGRRAGILVAGILRLLPYVLAAVLPHHGRDGSGDAAGWDAPLRLCCERLLCRRCLGRSAGPLFIDPAARRFALAARPLQEHRLSPAIHGNSTIRYRRLIPAGQ